MPDVLEKDTVATDTPVEVATGTGKRALRFADLLSKPVRTKEIPFGDTGQTIKIKAVGAQEFDDLIAAHPATQAQRTKAKTANQMEPQFNEDTFPPALIAACTLTPKLTAEQATELSHSTSWSQGEFVDWFLQCQRLCQQGLDVPFTSSG